MSFVNPIRELHSVSQGPNLTGLAKELYKVMTATKEIRVIETAFDVDFKASAEVSDCCKADVIEDTRENSRDHHDPIPVTICLGCGRECNLVPFNDHDEK